MVYPLSISALVSRAARGRGVKNYLCQKKPPHTQTSAIDPHTVFKTDISPLSSDARGLVYCNLDSHTP